jgi:hypothetical protein
VNKATTTTTTKLKVQTFDFIIEIGSFIVFVVVVVEISL